MSAEAVGQKLVAFLGSNPRFAAMLAALTLLHFLISGLHTSRVIGEWLLVLIGFLKHELHAIADLAGRLWRESTTWEIQSERPAGPRAIASMPQDVAQGGVATEGRRKTRRGS